MSWHFYIEFLVVGQVEYLFRIIYSFLPNTFPALCTRHTCNKHELFLAASKLPFKTALLANAREMCFNYTLDTEKDQQ
jgi:hypothetical protein